MENHGRVKVCPLCNRVFGPRVEVCEHDGQRLVRVRRDDTTDGAPVIDWEGPLAGDLVGSYRLESMIAEGGMGRIFRATHLTLGRRVAIKFLLPEHAARPDLVQRFFNEARSVNAIQHPHILEIYDFLQERSPDGRNLVYMVMEHLEGEDVRVRLAREGRLPAGAVVHIGAQVAEALAAAHSGGILHRDLKPDNIFLCRQPLDFVKLLDFGAAKAFGDRPGADLTRPGVAIGTPEYMAPEQIRNRQLDGRVDAYALGIVLYELLTGEVPFSAAKTAAVLAMHSRREPPRMSERGVDVPVQLESVILRCLAKDPGDRYPNLEAVGQALRAAVTPMGQAWPAPPAERVESTAPPKRLSPLVISIDEDEPGMPTLDRRFGAAGQGDQRSGSPTPKTVEALSVGAHTKENAPPTERAALGRGAEATHATVEVEPLPSDGLLGLMAQSRGGLGDRAEQDDDDDDELIAELAPHRPPRRTRHIVLFIAVVVLLAVAGTLAVLFWL